MARRPGRRPKPRGEKQGERVMLNLTRGERAALEAAAGREPLSSYVRRLVLRSLARRMKGTG
jgi:hypothetical protein